MKFLRTAVALAFAAMANLAAAADFPTKPVTLVVPFAPGGTVDIIGRHLADKLSKIWSQSVVIQNVPGAGTSIGAAKVAKAKPDGYTLLLNSGSFTMNAAVHESLPYDVVKDFTPIGMVGAGPLVLATGPSMNVKTYEEFMKVAKSRPLKYATAGLGTINQFASEMLKQAAGLTMEPVHYKGGAPAMADVIGGHADFFYGSTTQVAPQIRAGLLTGIIVSGAERSEATPDLPTAAEKGLTDAVVNQWWGVFGPAGLPADITAKINADLNEVLKTAETKEFLARDGGEPEPTTPAAFGEIVAKEMVRWGEIAKESNIKAQ